MWRAYIIKKHYKKCLMDVYHHDKNLKLFEAVGQFKTVTNPAKVTKPIRIKLTKRLKISGEYSEFPDSNAEFIYRPAAIIAQLSRDLKLWNLRIPRLKYLEIKAKNAFESPQPELLLDFLQKFSINNPKIDQYSKLKILKFLPVIDTKSHYNCQNIKFDNLIGWTQAPMDHWVVSNRLKKYKIYNYCTIGIGAFDFRQSPKPCNILNLSNNFKAAIVKKNIKSIVVNGNIGVGKSTVLKYAKTHSHYRVLFQPHIPSEYNGDIGSIWHNLNIFQFWSQYYNNYHAYSRIRGIKPEPASKKMLTLQNTYLNIPEYRVNSKMAVRIKSVSMHIYELVAVVNYLLHNYRISIMPKDSRVIIERDNYETLSIFSQFGLYGYAKQIVRGQESKPYRPALLSDSRWGLMPPVESIWISCKHENIARNLKIRHGNTPIKGREYELNRDWQKIMIDLKSS